MSEIEKNKLEKNIIQITQAFVDEMGIEDEIAHLAKVDEIKNDASLDEPKTAEGKAIRLKAIAYESGEIKSPFVKKFDYNKLRDDTTNVALNEFLKAIGKYNHLILPTQETAEGKDLFAKDYDNLSLDFFRIANEHNVGIGEYEYMFKALGAIMEGIGKYTQQQVAGHRAEIMSRLLGAKNPGTDKFDQTRSTYKNLIDSLEVVRKDTGGKLDDYFNVEEAPADK